MYKFFLLGLMSFCLLGCSSTGDGYMQQETLLISIKQNNAPVIIDVRSDAEYQSSHVPNAIHVPFWSAFSNNKLDSLEKNKMVVLYCAHGPRAGVAKFALSLAGFDDIRYLAGHMTAWTEAGLPVER